MAVKLWVLFHDPLCDCGQTPSLGVKSILAQFEDQGLTEQPSLYPLKQEKAMKAEGPKSGDGFVTSTSWRSSSELQHVGMYFSDLVFCTLKICGVSFLNSFMNLCYSKKIGTEEHMPIHLKLRCIFFLQLSNVAGLSTEQVVDHCWALSNFLCAASEVGISLSSPHIGHRSPLGSQPPCFHQKLFMGQQSQTNPRICPYLSKLVSSYGRCPQGFFGVLKS